MTKPNQRGESRESDKNIKPVAHRKSTDDKIQDAMSKHIESEHTANDATNNKIISVDVVSVKNQKNWQPIIANIVSAFAVAVSIAMAVVTYRLYDIASSQSKSANTAATIAKKTFEETEKYDSASLAMQREAFDSNNKDAISKYKRDTSTFNLQVKALKQNQEQFTKQNEPFIQVYIDTIIYINRPRIIIRYVLTNLTPTPIQVLTFKSFIVPASIEPTFKAFSSKYENAGKFYIIKESPQKRYITRNVITNQQTMEWIKSGFYSVYWECEFTYQNLISYKMRIYRFAVKIGMLADGRIYPEFIYNENKDVK